MKEKRERHMYSPARSRELLRKSFEAGDRVFIVKGNPSYFVTSESQPWRLYEVNFNRPDQCDCKSSVGRGECRHVVRASWFAQNMLRRRSGQELIPPPEGFTLHGERVEKEKAA